MAEPRTSAGPDARPEAPATTGSTSRVRSRLARFGQIRGPQQSPVIEPLVATHRGAHPKAEVRALQDAYDLAETQHRGQLRKSGDPYITHPVAVATILAELGMTPSTRAAITSPKSSLSWSRV